MSMDLRCNDKKACRIILPTMFAMYESSREAFPTLQRHLHKSEDTCIRMDQSLSLLVGDLNILR